MPRANVYLSDVNEHRIRQVLNQTGFKLSNLVEAVALCLNKDELETLRVRYAEMKRIEDELNGVITNEILARLKGMNGEQLKQVLDAMKMAVT